MSSRFFPIFPQNMWLSALVKLKVPLVPYDAISQICYLRQNLVTVTGYVHTVLIVHNISSLELPQTWQHITIFPILCKYCSHLSVN